MRTLFFLLAISVLATTAWAEPTFLAKQYTRCTACHYSPTGGGLLTPYGRLLSHRELATTGATGEAPAAGAADDPHGEQAFLYGALGDTLGPVQLGLELRPSQLRIGFPGGHQDLNLLMNLDLSGAVQKHGWTAYGTVGREPPHSAVRDGRTLPDSAFISYEHWISYQPDERFQLRVGRFLPAYGVRFADHTTYTRRYLDLDRNDQVYGLEVSHTTGPSLVQVMVSPGKAEAILHDRSRRGFSPRAAGSSTSLRARPSWDRASIVTRRMSVHGQARRVARSASRQPRGCRSGRKWTPTWRRRRRADARGWWSMRPPSRCTAGIWLKFSPQLRTAGGAPGSSQVRRFAFAADLLPRTHWNVNLAYYLDHSFNATDVDTRWCSCTCSCKCGPGPHAPHRRGRQDARLHRRPREAVIGLV